MGTRVERHGDGKQDGRVVSRRRRRILLIAILCISLAVPLLALVGVVRTGMATRQHSRRTFDSATWRISLEQETDDPIRLHMVDDLLKQHPLIGLSRAEVNSLLGTPPQTDYFKEYDFVYWLGPERGWISIDSEWLAIKFGADDRVTQARILRD